MNTSLRHPTTDSGWWNDFYDDVAMVVLADQDPDVIRNQADQIIELTGLSSGDTAVEQCCGLGQHACEIANRGVNIVALDQSALYINHARRLASDRELDVTFLVGDAFEYVHPEPVDAVYNWHSSFGYAADDACNMQMLRTARRSIRTGGSMLLEFPNMLHLLANFRETIQTQHPGDVMLTRTSRISAATGTLHQAWDYRRGGQSLRCHKSALRIYLPDRLIAMFRESGFDDVRALSPRGHELTRDDPRCIILGRNPSHV